jgi:hypothetical protein
MDRPLSCSLGLALRMITLLLLPRNFITSPNSKDCNGIRTAFNLHFYVYLRDIFRGVSSMGGDDRTDAADAASSPQR